MNKTRKDSMMTRYTKSLAGFAALMLTLWACNKASEQPNDETELLNPTTGQTINLSLEGNEPVEAEAIGTDETVRSVDFEVSDAGSKLKMSEEPMNSVAIIANSNKTSIYYIELPWLKEKNKNRLYVKDYVITHDIDGRAITLNPRETWYIMGYVGGTYDKRNKQVSYDPNGSSLLAAGNGERLTKAVPIAFPWTKLELKQYGDYKLALSGLDKVKFKTLGTILRVTLKNSLSETVRIKSLRFLSTAMTTTKGYYDLSTNQLPAVTTGNLIPFTRSLSHIADYYQTEEPIYTLQEPVDLRAGETYNKSFLLWLMPLSVEARNARTQIVADAVRLLNGREQTVPKMSTLYVWGTERVFSERTRHIARANVLRAKMPLEYFGTNYAGYGDMRSVMSRSGVRATDFATGNMRAYNKNIPLFSYAQAQTTTTLARGWHVPKYREARALFMVDLSNFGTRSYEALAFSPRVSNRTVKQEVIVNGEAATYTDIYRVGSTIYALRFDGGGTGARKYYSAWRYSYTSGANGGIKIESVYLGDNFRGSISDITNTNFWTFHKDDIVVRNYTNSYYAYIDSNNSTTYSYGGSNLTGPSFWAIHENIISELRNGQRVWSFSHPAGNTPYMGHRQIYNDYSNRPFEHLAHIIPLEDANTPWASN